MTAATLAADAYATHSAYLGINGGRHPLSWTQSAEGVKHPVRLALPEGAVYRREIPDLGKTLSLRRIDLARDLDAFTRWMNDPRVDAFWEQPGDAAVQAAYIKSVLADPHKDPLIACFDDEPFGYFELYWALEDRLGPYYDADPFDRGMHLLVGERQYLGPAFARAWIESLSHFMFLDDARTMRLVGEPRADNAALLKYLGSAPGWKKIKEFDFPHKRAALVMCERDAFFRDAGWS